MPTIICAQCAKPWVDSKYSRCPNCGAPPIAVVSDTAATAAAPGVTRSSPTTAPVPAGVRGSAVGGITTGQVDRIIALLESQQGARRVDVTGQAVRASQTLAGLGILVLVGGVVVVLAGIFTVLTGQFLAGLLLAVAGAASAGLYWGLLTTASVVAGYVANRST